MKIQELTIRIKDATLTRTDHPTYTKGSFQISIYCDGRESKNVLIFFPEDDLETKFDQIFETAKKSIKEALKKGDK